METGLFNVALGMEVTSKQCPNLFHEYKDRAEGSTLHFVVLCKYGL